MMQNFGLYFEALNELALKFEPSYEDDISYLDILRHQKLSKVVKRLTNLDNNRAWPPQQN